MRTLLIVALLVLALVLGLGFALRSERLVLNVVEWAVDNFTSLDLEFSEPRFDLLRRSVSASEVHLYQDESEGLPLVSVLDFKGSVRLRDLINGNLKNTRLAARAVTVYVAEDDGVEDPTPTAWLSYAVWLPKQLSVNSVHIISNSQEVFVFPIKDVQGRRDDADTFTLEAQADYDGERLDIGIQLLAIREAERFIGLELGAEAHAPQSDSHIMVAGELHGDETGLRYDLTMQADYRRIEDFLDGFEGAANLANGALHIEGSLVGDLEQFTLAADDVILDNSPAYRFQAKGQLVHRENADTEIQLNASGDLETAGTLLSRTNLELTALGEIQVAAQISGTLAQPRVDHFEVTSRNPDGLYLNSTGKFSFEELRQGTPNPNNTVATTIGGPSLSVLSPWTGELPIEPGPWQASGEITGARGALSVSDLELTLGEREKLQLIMRGEIANLELSDTMTLQSLQGIALDVEIYTDDSGVAAQWFDLPLPPYQQVAARGKVSGNGNALRVAETEVQITASDLDATLSQLQFELTFDGENTPTVSDLQTQISALLSDTSALSQYLEGEYFAIGELQASALLTQQDERYDLRNIDATVTGETLRLRGFGSAQDIAGSVYTDLAFNFTGARTHNFLNSVLDDFNYAEPLGLFEGSFNLLKPAQDWHIQNLRLATSDTDKLDITANGEIRDLTGFITANLKTRLAVSDQALLEALTGFRLNPVVAEFTFSSEPGELALSTQTQIGDSRIAAKILANHQDDKLTALDVDVDAPQLIMDDLGLQAEVDAQSEYTPAELIDDNAGTRANRVLFRNPRFPTDVAIKIGSFRGENLEIDGLDIHTTGENGRYTLRKFNLDYATGSAEVRGIIDLNPTPIAISLAGQGLNIPLNNLSKDIGADMDVDGRATFRGGITARGVEPEQWLSSLDGNVALALEDTVIEGAAYDLLATSMLQWIYSGGALEKTTIIDCSMLQLDLDDGIATGDSLFVETKNMVATGTVMLNLVEQTMNVKLDPRSKSRRFQIPSKVTIRGDMDDPRVIASPITATADAYAEALTLIPSLTMKMFGIGRNRPSQSRPCAPTTSG